MQSTLKRELEELEIVGREAIGATAMVRLPGCADFESQIEPTEFETLMF
jgi:hypothetical protein